LYPISKLTKFQGQYTKYHPKGSKHNSECEYPLEIKITKEENDTNIVISVKDNGIGFPDGNPTEIKNSSAIIDGFFARMEEMTGSSIKIVRENNRGAVVSLILDRKVQQVLHNISSTINDKQHD